MSRPSAHGDLDGADFVDPDAWLPKLIQPEKGGDS